MIYGVIDIGSNTIRLSLYQYEGGAQIQRLLNHKTMAGLASYIEEGHMTLEGIRVACRTLAAEQQILQNLGVRAYYAFATAPLRNIDNAEEVKNAIYAHTGIPVDVLSGEEEARLDFVGATHALTYRDGLLADIGGGSTELVPFADGEMRGTFSMPVGSLNLYSKYVCGLLPTQKERSSIQKAVAAQLQRISLPEGAYAHLCGVGGTIRAAGRLCRRMYGIDPDAGIESAAIASLLRDLRASNPQSIKRILQAAPERVHTIVPGLIVLQHILKTFSVQTIHISPYGVREGYLTHRILKEGAFHASQA